MFWKINKCWICGLLDSWLGLEFFFTRTRGLGLGLWGDDSDSDSDWEVMTRTRTRIWQPGLGHSTVVISDQLFKLYEELLHYLRNFFSSLKWTSKLWCPFYISKTIFGVQIHSNVSCKLLVFSRDYTRMCQSCPIYQHLRRDSYLL